jgi:hypothetical protein
MNYIVSFWHLADVSLAILYLGFFIPMKYIGYLLDDVSATYETFWKMINILIIFLTFVKIN